MKSLTVASSISYLGFRLALSRICPLRFPPENRRISSFDGSAPGNFLGAHVKSENEGKIEINEIIRSVLSLIVLFSVLYCAPVRASIAQDVTPDALVKSVTLNVIDAIKKNGGTQSREGIEQLVEAIVLPHFDFTHMTRLAMGRSWRIASPKQRQSLISEFKTLLVHTYSASLSSYRDQRIEFEPLRAVSGDGDVTVRCVVKQPGTAPIPIHYEMEKTPEGWQVFDVNIDGVSLVVTYRDTFDSQIREFGIDGLIKSLADKNRSNGILSKRAGA